MRNFANIFLFREKHRPRSSVLDPEFLLFVLVALLGVCVRLANITHELDCDEVFTIRLTNTSFWDMIGSSLADRTHPPLYNLVLWTWKQIFGSSEIAARALSICLYVGFMVSTRIFLRGFCSRTKTTLILFLFAASPFFAFYGQEVRVYALLALLISINAVALNNLYTRYDTKSLTYWLISCALLVHTQYLAIIFILLGSLVFLLHTPQQPKKFMTFTLGSVSTIIPWIILAYWRPIFNGRDPIPNINWIRRPSFSDIQWFYATIIHGGNNRVVWFFEFMYDHIKSQIKTYAALIFLVIAISYIAKFILKIRISFEERLTFTFAFIAPLIFYIISVSSPKSIFLPRQLMGAAFGCVVLLGSSLPQSRPLLSRAYLTACVVYGLVACSNVMTTDIRSKYREMATFVSREFPNATLVTEDDFDHRQPMIFYTGTDVYRLKAFNSTGDEFLYLCESGHCSEVYTGAFTSRAEHLKSVTWGNEPWPCTLNLFKIHAASATGNR